MNSLSSARRNSWSRFWQDPQRTGIAEYLVEQEQFTAASRVRDDVNRVFFFV
jgi:hypothetical protein